GGPVGRPFGGSHQRHPEVSGPPGARTTIGAGPDRWVGPPSGGVVAGTMPPDGDGPAVRRRPCSTWNTGLVESPLVGGRPAFVAGILRAGGQGAWRKEGGCRGGRPRPRSRLTFKVRVARSRRLRAQMTHTLRSMMVWPSRCQRGSEPTPVPRRPEMRC